MKLLKQAVTKENGNKYVDLWLTYETKEKVCAVRVKTVFGREFEKLCDIAQEVPTNEPIEKYL